jgi:hypothetical protein
VSGRTEPTQPPTMAAMLQLAARARTEFLAERARLEHAITTSVEAAGLPIVRTDPVEEVAAHPDAIHRLRSEIFDQQTPDPLLGRIGSLTGLPVIADDALPPGEVHLRPHPNHRETEVTE